MLDGSIQTRVGLATSRIPLRDKNHTIDIEAGDSLDYIRNTDQSIIHALDSNIKHNEKADSRNRFENTLHDDSLDQGQFLEKPFEEDTELKD